jgi:hypothetical protein
VCPFSSSLSGSSSLSPPLSSRPSEATFNAEDVAKVEEV